VPAPLPARPSDTRRADATPAAQITHPGAEPMARPATRPALISAATCALSADQAESLSVIRSLRLTCCEIDYERRRDPYARCACPRIGCPVTRTPDRWTGQPNGGVTVPGTGRPCSARTAATGRPDADSDRAVAGRRMWRLCGDPPQNAAISRRAPGP
jgi:hypothetical protein